MFTWLASSLVGRQNERPYIAPAFRFDTHFLQQRQDEARSLASARLGAGEEIVSLEDVRNRFLLDRRSVFVALLFDRAQQFGRQAEFFK